MNAKHTPGPWDDGIYHAVTDGGRTYAYIRAPKMLVPIAAVPIGVEGYGREEGEANARLMAAAPALSDAVKGLIGLCQLVRNRGDLPTEARQALTHNHRLIAAYEALSSAGIEGFQPSDFDAHKKEPA